MGSDVVRFRRGASQVESWKKAKINENFSGPAFSYSTLQDYFNSGSALNQCHPYYHTIKTIQVPRAGKPRELIGSEQLVLGKVPRRHGAGMRHVYLVYDSSGPLWARCGKDESDTKNGCHFGYEFGNVSFDAAVLY